jgi:glycosyltransferase involved in cell wall biosynthesis
MEHPLISICIPAYKRTSFLKRLLDSIAEQDLRNFEVVITDDSPDNQVESLVKNYSIFFPIHYHKNPKPLGSPANWNKSIQLATGKWIKIMHDDDWFADAESLGKFYQATLGAKADFIFSAFVNEDLEKKTSKIQIISPFNLFMLRRDPLYLFRTNYIGHPSTTLIRNNRKYWYDEKVKWVVDFEFYIRILKESNRFIVLKEPLIYIGIGEEQITKQAFRNPEIELPENFYLLTILGKKALRNIFVYDYFWRLLRNLRITHVDQVNHYLTNGELVRGIRRLIYLQRVFGQKTMAQLGLYSKLVMLVGYISQYFKISSSS